MYSLEEEITLNKIKTSSDLLWINSALGIDASIDVFTFDPVAEKGDGGISDYLYEKGNQLTVLAYALQNITNNLNMTDNNITLSFLLKELKLSLMAKNWQSKSSWTQSGGLYHYHSPSIYGPG